MVNLLPQDAVARLRTRYYARLSSAFLLLVLLVFVLGTVFLLPSYFLSQGAADASARYLAAAQQSATVREHAGATGALATLAEQVLILKQYQGAPVVVPAISEITGVIPKGILVSKIAFGKREDGTASLTVAGTAATRATLLAFVDALKAGGRFSGVSVPVSQLASDSNIDFSLTFGFAAQKP